MEYCADKSSDILKNHSSLLWKRRGSFISEVACQNKYERAEEEGHIMEKEKKLLNWVIHKKTKITHFSQHNSAEFSVI